VSFKGVVLAELDSRSSDGYHEGAIEVKSRGGPVAVGGSLSGLAWGFNLAAITLPAEAPVVFEEGLTSITPPVNYDASSKQLGSCFRMIDACSMILKSFAGDSSNVVSARGVRGLRDAVTSQQGGADIDDGHESAASGSESTRMTEQGLASAQVRI
jgi:hypothetical protein